MGERKTKSLLACGANVKVISKTFTAELEKLAVEKRITILRKEFEEADAGCGAFLIFCATDDFKLNRQVFEAAEKRGILVNVADRPEICNFIVPAVVRRGPLLACVSTSAAAPAFAKKLKKILSEAFDNGYAPLFEFLSEKREFIKTSVGDIELRRKLFDEMLTSPLETLFLSESMDMYFDENFDYDDYKLKYPEIIEKAEKIYASILKKYNIIT